MNEVLPSIDEEALGRKSEAPGEVCNRMENIQCTNELRGRDAPPIRERNQPCAVRKQNAVAC